MGVMWLLLHSTSVVRAQDVERRAAQFVNPSGTGLAQRDARAVKRWSLPVGESYILEISRKFLSVLSESQVLRDIG
jgi:hypothetical protein